MDIDVVQIWDDARDQDGIRPASVEVELREYVKIGTVDVPVPFTHKTIVLNKRNDWSGTFKVDKDGNYDVNEVRTNVITGYDTATTYATESSGNAENGFVITNRHTPVTISVSGSKTWDDAGDAAGKRPESITIGLFANGQRIDSREVTRDDSWAWNFTGLPWHSADGKTIEYTITEDAVDGYTSRIDGFNVANRYSNAPDPAQDPDPGKAKYSITYQLNGGEYNGSTEDIVESYEENAVISIHAAPVREGNRFLCWKGSEYQPGDSYTVTGDHTFTAQWKQLGTPGGSDDPDHGKSGRDSDTGDDTSIVLCLALLLTSAAILTLIMFRRRRSM